MERFDVEEIVLGMAEIVEENRILRRALNDAERECEMYKAYFYHETQKADILSDIGRHNASVMSIHSAGWLTNKEYIEDWQEELARRMSKEE